MKKETMLWSITIATILFMAGGCSTMPKSQGDRLELSSDVDQAIFEMIEKDPDMQSFFDSSYGYAVFPKVFKAAFTVGGAHGKGMVYERGSMIGYTSLSQATIGFSFGGQFFREIIFFENKVDLDKFKSEKFSFTAQASAVALRSGVAATTGYKDGMAVFVVADSGLMYDASIGGQKFKYAPLTF